MNSMRASYKGTLSAIKSHEVRQRPQLDEPGKHRKGSKPVTKARVPYEPTSVKVQIRTFHIDSDKK